jgi:hypothetical protein
MKTKEKILNEAFLNKQLSQRHFSCLLARPLTISV